MTYPPQFSSTLTYANRYDLDQIDVFFDGDSNNPMFFQVTGLPNPIAIGKHYFNLSTSNINNQIAGNTYNLRENSRILFEFKSINNVVLKSDVLDINQQNGVATCFVEVLQDPLRTFKEVEDGMGTLTIVGSLADDPSQGIYIPPKFRNAMNYRCIYPIEVRKNLMGGNSPILTNVEHTNQTLNGQFTFVRAAITSPPNENNEGTTYGDDGLPDDGIRTPGGGTS